MRRSMVAALAVLIGVMSAFAQTAAAQQVWFGPRLPRAPHTHVVGIDDWHDLLRPDAPWQRAASRTQILYLNRGYIVDASDDELKAVAATMTARGIAIATSDQPVAVDQSDQCGKTEGYDTAAGVAAFVQRLKRNGVTLGYLGLDGPLWFGHYATGPEECRFSIEEVVRRTAANLRIVTDAFPQVVVGDIEGTTLTAQPDWKETYVRFKHDLDEAAGRPTEFLQLDVNWRQPNAPEAIKEMAATAHSLGMKLGIVYNGDNEDDSDAAWIDHAWHNVAATESEYGIVPDQAVFASWNRFPSRALPESSPEAHTWLIDRYRLPRTRFEAQREGNAWHVLLVDASGRPLSGERVSVTRLGYNPAEPPPIHAVSGTVPIDAERAILGWRINTECLCAGDNDLVIGDLVYREEKGGAAGQTLPASDFAARRSDDGVIVTPQPAGNGMLYRVRVERGGHLLLNSPPFPVTPGAAYRLSVPLGVADVQGLYGYATIIWVDRQEKGLFRSNLEDPGERAPAATLKTAGDGSFRIPSAGQTQELFFAGTDNLRPALARLAAAPR